MLPDLGLPPWHYGDSCKSWMQANGVETYDVEVGASNERGPGHGILATQRLSGADRLLMRVPRDLVISKEKVHECARSDERLRHVIEVNGDWAKSARGAILIYLLFQFSYDPNDNSTNGSYQLRDYMQYLPQGFSVPTFWNEDEIGLLQGTSLQPAIKAKMKSLEREYSSFRTATLSIPWCNKYWWAADSTLKLDFNDWKRLDALYRSRALDLPNCGEAIVPCLDMANHAADDQTTARYEADSEGNALLLLLKGAKVKFLRDVTITYGDDKGACELLFSYGFVDRDMTDAKAIFLDLFIDDDDPLGLAKAAFASRSEAPGMKLVSRSNHIEAEGLFVWMCCVNEEDGLQLSSKPGTDENGPREVQAAWRGSPLKDMNDLYQHIQQDPKWPILRLRATVIQLRRIDFAIYSMDESTEAVERIPKKDNVQYWHKLLAMKLGDLEARLLMAAADQFEAMRLEQMRHPVVLEWSRRDDSDD